MSSSWAFDVTCGTITTGAPRFITSPMRTGSGRLIFTIGTAFAAFAARIRSSMRERSRASTSWPMMMKSSSTIP